jgi:uncharacterized repeat protein (TIGR01451 family)
MRMLRLISLLSLLAIALTVFFPSGAAVAQNETPPESISLSTPYPTLEATASGSFDFTVELSYVGETDLVFNLNATVPPGWNATITPQYDTSKIISSITIAKSGIMPTTASVEITASPPGYPLANPGDYTVTFKTTSGNLTAQINLTAKITARYSLIASPANSLYSTDATAGHDNTYSFTVTNFGTAPIDNISFSSDKPTGWDITFKPDSIESLEINSPKTIDVDIKPPNNTVTGDYMIMLSVAGKQASAVSMNIRVTVKTPTVWGWVGVGVIAIVVVGLVFIFIRFGRR